MPRTLTTYKRPSILSRIESETTVEGLLRIRSLIGHALLTGQLDPDPKTARKWHEAMLSRVAHFISTAENARDASYVFNCVFTWYSRPVQEQLSALLARVTAPMPCAADAWRAVQ